ncbi:endospore germination permease [Paenibacillus sp. TAB 01]|uniref:GerAB/ArcD/ProY family transporter n=1 Tax=Paenibacillus sp. TAB 01 TaxID=3368988 RepID=UPI0037536678
MINQEPISLRQLTVLTALCVIGDSILVLPAFPAEIARQDAWISGLLGAAAGIPLLFVFYALARLYPDQSLFGFLPQLAGKWLGTGISILYMFYFFQMTAVLAREVGDFLTTQIIPETPIQSILLMYLAIVIYGTRLGMHTLTRTAELLFFAFGFLFLILTVFISPQIELQNVQPVWEKGIKPVMAGAITSASFPYLEIGSIFLLLPYVKRTKGTGRSILWGALIGGFVINILLVLSILVLNHTITSAQMYPTYSLAKKINVAHFLTRLEAMLAVMWFITIFIKTCVNFHALCLGFQQVLRLNRYDRITLPLGMIILVFSIASAPNITYYNEVLGSYWPFFDFTFSAALPLLLCLAGFVRKKAARKAGTPHPKLSR